MSACNIKTRYHARQRTREHHSSYEKVNPNHVRMDNYVANHVLGSTPTEFPQESSTPSLEGKRLTLSGRHYLGNTKNN